MRRIVRSERALASKLAICICTSVSKRYMTSMIAHAAYMIDDLLPVGTVAVELQVREARVSMCNIGEQLVIGASGRGKIHEFEAREVRHVHPF